MSERLEQLRKLHEAEPEDPFLSYGIALEHAKAGEHEAALEWLDETLSVEPGYLYAWFQKGKVLADAGRGDQARQALEQGIAKAKAAGDEKAMREMAELLDGV